MDCWTIVNLLKTLFKQMRLLTQSNHLVVILLLKDFYLFNLKIKDPSYILLFYNTNTDVLPRKEVQY